MLVIISVRLFFFNDPATTEIYTLSLHDALPISAVLDLTEDDFDFLTSNKVWIATEPLFRSEERFSRNAETDLVCRLLLEKKNGIGGRPRFPDLRVSLVDDPKDTDPYGETARKDR